MNTLFALRRTWCPWCGDHMLGGGWFMALGWLVILFVILLAVWAIATGRWRGYGPRETDADPAETILRQQYARGEIDEETFRRRLQELRRS
jgi:putative membrane protein